MGQVMTVRGPIEGSELGVTLPHEHVLISMAYAFPASDQEATRPITMDQLGVLRNDMMRNINTITLDESSDPVGELAKARQAGVGTVVELTPPELGRDPAGLARISEITGINIVCGTGHYLRLQQRPATRRLIIGSPPEAIAEPMIHYLTEGIGETGIRAGVVGEIGLFSPVHPGELWKRPFSPIGLPAPRCSCISWRYPSPSTHSRCSAGPNPTGSGWCSATWTSTSGI